MEWTKEDDELIIEYIESGDKRLFLELYPKILDMATIIFKHYGYNNTIKDDYVIKEAVAKVATNLKRFNKNKGRPYSFIYRVIKNYYLDVIRIINLYNEEEYLDDKEYDVEDYGLWVDESEVAKKFIHLIKQNINLDKDRIKNQMWKDIIVYIDGEYYQSKNNTLLKFLKNKEKYKYSTIKRFISDNKKLINKMIYSNN